MRDTCMEQYSCMVSCMVFLLYSTKWRTETHADSVPVGEDGVTEGAGYRHDRPRDVDQDADKDRALLAPGPEARVPRKR